MTRPLLESAYSALMHAADFILTEGVQHARSDDPHRFARLPAEFDDGKAARRLQIDYLPGGEVQVSHVLIGRSGDELKQVAVFTTTLQGSVDMPTH